GLQIDEDALIEMVRGTVVRAEAIVPFLKAALALGNRQGLEPTGRAAYRGRAALAAQLLNHWRVPDCGEDPDG
ncbi:unnamed protein product, partial [marine sediment metagenome]